MGLFAAVKGGFRALTHKHTYLTRDAAQFIVCAQRWPGGKTTIFYRPHRLALWEQWEPEEFLRAMDERGWSQEG